MWTGALVLAAVMAGQQAVPPPPQPFPKPAPARPGSQPTIQPAPPPDAPAVSTAPDSDRGPSETVLGIPLYPGAQFLGSYDAGRGQRFYLYGTTLSFVDCVAFYRSVLKQKGELLFDAPATHSFEVGRFREQTMAFPSGVTIKDFQSEISQGYPNPKLGAQPARFPTVIQIVPVVPDK